MGLTESVGRASCGHKANNAGDLHPVCCDGYESFWLGPCIGCSQSVSRSAGLGLGTRRARISFKTKLWEGIGDAIYPPPLVFNFLKRIGVASKVSVRDPLGVSRFTMCVRYSLLVFV